MGALAGTIPLSGSRQSPVRVASELAVALCHRQLLARHKEAAQSDLEASSKVLVGDPDSVTETHPLSTNAKGRRMKTEFDFETLRMKRTELKSDTDRVH